MKDPIGRLTWRELAEFAAAGALWLFVGVPLFVFTIIALLLIPF